MTAAPTLFDGPAHRTHGGIESSPPARGGSVLAIPVLADASPDWERRLTGELTEVSAEGAELALKAAPERLSGAFVLVFQGESAAAACAGFVLQETRRNQGNSLFGSGTWGGIAAELLQPEGLTPRLDRKTLEFRVGFPHAVLQKWVRIGVLQPVLVDRVHVCPKCQGLPTFRQGCTNCGSIRFAREQFIHHLGCAHVGPVRDFEASGQLVCPKCRTRRLVPGSDYEYLPGPFDCRDCHWHDTRLEDVGQCLRCGLRFPRHQGLELELEGYHANRFDPLVYLSQP